MPKKQVMSNPDFSGYATRNDVKCTDGRVIRKDAFKECDGMTVPLVWQHFHDVPANVLGHGILENREDGVYVRCKFNDTAAAKDAKTLVQHGDITSLSIYANQLKEQAKNVIHGVIREVSLVMAGANPGAVIDNLSIAHADGSSDLSEDEAVIYTDSELALTHEDSKESEKEPEKKSEEAGETVQDVFNTLSEKQKTVVYALIGEIVGDKDLEQSDDENNSIKHNTEGGQGMKRNVFDKGDKEVEEMKSLTHDQFKSIVSDAQACGSFKEAFLAHAVEYGIENIDYLFPDAKTIANSPAMMQRKMEWVSIVMNGTHHTPFSRIKTLYADITADEARAKGYVKASLKTEEVVKLFKRVTNPTTIYKKQKLDRDDIVDITDLDVVAWLKAEMRVMLDEELARAVLTGDGRDPADPDKISEDNIRPIYKDNDTYAFRVQAEEDDDAEDIIEAIIRARKNYKGSGNPTLFTTSDFLTDMLLLKDSLGHRLFSTKAELASTLRVADIVDVEAMDGLTYEDDEEATFNLLGIMVNLKDYTIGADKGGGISMFDDFDIDYNQYKYLLETRCSGALTLPKSAMIIEQAAAGG